MSDSSPVSLNLSPVIPWPSIDPINSRFQLQRIQPGQFNLRRDWQRWRVLVNTSSPKRNDSNRNAAIGAGVVGGVTFLVSVYLGGSCNECSRSKSAILILLGSALGAGVGALLGYTLGGGNNSKDSASNRSSLAQKHSRGFEFSPLNFRKDF